jgi:hypothetical protein
MLDNMEHPNWSLGEGQRGLVLERLQAHDWPEAATNTRIATGIGTTLASGEVETPAYRTRGLRTLSRRSRARRAHGVAAASGRWSRRQPCDDEVIGSFRGAF